MKDGYWVIRTYESGQVGEKIKFWVPGARPKGRLTRKNKSDIRKAVQNEESSARQMARLLNANFRPGDWLLGLDYSPDALLRLELEAAGGVVPVQGGRLQGMGNRGREGRIATVPSGPRNDTRAKGKRRTAECRPCMTEAQRMDAVRNAAEKMLVNCIRRVKRELEKDGIELKYVTVTADVDGKTGEAVRVHHHLVINREARDAFVRKWQDKGLGGVAWSPLEKQDDYLEIAKYILAQARKTREGENKYTSSRNLVRPRPKDRVATSSSEVRVPKGCRLLHRQEFKPGKAQYIRYRIETDSGGAKAG